MKLYNKIKRLLATHVEPPSYEIKRAILLDFAIEFNLNTLVETGTFLGDTVEFFKTKFQQVYSIELADELAKKAIIRFQNDHNVKIIKGDSGTLLNSLVTEFSVPILFWLDGHYSSEFQMGNEYIVTAKSEKNTPIEKELKAILNSNMDHVILIDDARLFNGNDDYPTVKQIRKICKFYKSNYMVDVENDIIRLYPNKK
jgi:hypothetical protein